MNEAEPPITGRARAFRALSRGIPVMLAIEGAAGIVTGFWLVVSFAGMAGVGYLLEVSAPAWAAAGAAQAAAFWIVPSGAMVIAARRWWIYPMAFGRTRRVWIYFVLVAHLLACVFGALAGVWIATLAGIVGVGLTASALAVGTLTRIEEVDAPRWHPHWLRGLIVGTVAVALLSLGAGVGAAITTDESDDLLAAVYPDRSVVCRGRVDQACAKEAARRSGKVVAWLPDRNKRQSRAFVVSASADTTLPIGPGRVFQDVREGWVRVTVYTDPSPPLFGGRKPAKAIEAEGTRADVFFDDMSIDVEWTRVGVAYRITAFRTTEDRESLIKSARRALAEVRYTTP